jgi:hypothetical protein
MTCGIRVAVKKNFVNVEIYLPEKKLVLYVPQNEQLSKKLKPRQPQND